MRASSLWIGTYPRPGADPGSGEGIFRTTVDLDTGALSGAERVAMLPSPSFLARHSTGRVLYAVGETSPGSLAQVEVADDGTVSIGRTVPTGGSDPCHVVAADGRVWVTNYADGVATTWPTDTTGSLGASNETFGHAGSGPVLDRQEGPHAHFAHLATAGGEVALVADLGTDELRVHRAGPATEHGGELAATFPPGTGPRHVVELPDGALLVVGELDCRIHLLVADASADRFRYQHVDTFPITDATWGPDGGPGFPSHITLSPDGRHVHVGVRGPDVLTVLRLEHSALRGWALTPVADVELGEGAWPRHHAVVGPADGGDDLIVVAAQNTSELVSVRVDRASGTGEVVGRLPYPVPPACVLES